MNQYTITITRNGETVYARGITADAALEYVCPSLMKEATTLEKVNLIGKVDPLPPIDKKAVAKKVKALRPPKRKKGVKYCRQCGKPGHMAKTCPSSKAPEKESRNASEAIDEMRGAGFKPISPEKLHMVKTMLANGADHEAIAAETGLDVDRIERMASQLGH